MIRQDFYISGRVAMYTGSLYAWGFLLGHAIEATLKAALAHLGTTERRLLNCHDLPRLFEAVRTRGLFCNTRVSTDFIDYVDDFFWCRYPSQLEEVESDRTAKERNFAFSVGTLAAFDDLFLQLDDELASAVGRHEVSVGFRSACAVESTTGRHFFHANYPALDRLRAYTELVRANATGREQALAVLERGSDELSRCPQVGFWSARPKTANPALDFVYPRPLSIDGGFKLPLM